MFKTYREKHVSDVTAFRWMGNIDSVVKELEANVFEIWVRVNEAEGKKGDYDLWLKNDTDGCEVIAHEGDWVLIRDNRVYTICPDDEFKAMYEEV
jgi:hypothetical protein